MGRKHMHCPECSVELGAAATTVHMAGQMGASWNLCYPCHFSIDPVLLLLQNQNTSESLRYRIEDSKNLY